MGLLNANIAGVPPQGEVLLGKSGGIQSFQPADTNAVKIPICIIPGGFLGLNSQVEVVAGFDNNSGNVSNTTVRARYSLPGIIQPGYTAFQAGRSIRMRWEFGNNNSLTQQWVPASGLWLRENRESAAVNFTTMNVDSTQDQELYIEVAVQTANDIIRCIYWRAYAYL